MTTTKSGQRDEGSPCPQCKRQVWISDVVRYPDATRLYWFLTGWCRRCQNGT
jgi:hypothetical protein